jgi:hypothetical protein
MVSPGFRKSEVTDLLDRYKAGRLTLDELAERFRSRRWPRRAKTPPPQNYLERAARAEEDPDPYESNSFDDVEAAFFQHELSVEEFDTLKAAMAEAVKAEERGEL